MLGKGCKGCPSRWEMLLPLTPLTTTNTTKKPPDRGSQGAKTTPQTPFFKLDPFQWWHGVENVARVKINGESCMAFWDNGAQINTIMPKYVSDHSLQMGLITNLLGAKVTCIGLGNTYIRPLGYIVIWVQVDRVQGYDKDQIALVIPDLSNVVAWIPIILGIPTISWVIKCDEGARDRCLVMPWANARVAHPMSVCRMTTVEIGDGIEEEPSPDSYDQVMFTQNVDTIDPSPPTWCRWRQEGPILENVLTSWYKPCRLKMALCHRALLYKTCTQN